MEHIEIRGAAIRLGQLLKLANLVEDGAMAKQLIQAGEILVNGVPETRRGRQLIPGDQVTCGEQTIEIATNSG